MRETAKLGTAGGIGGIVVAAIIVLAQYLLTPHSVPTPAPTIEPELVIVTDASGVRIKDAGIEAVALKLSAGTWRVQAIPKPGDKGFSRTITVADEFGPTPPPPGPVPPPPPPVTVGKRALLIAQDTASKTPDWARTINALRNGPDAAYLDSKGHTLSILDTDNPSPLVTAWTPHLSGMALPVLLVIDQETKALIHKESIPASATSASIVSIVKAHGG